MTEKASFDFDKYFKDFDVKNIIPFEHGKSFIFRFVDGQKTVTKSFRIVNDRSTATQAVLISQMILDLIKYNSRCNLPLTVFSRLNMQKKISAFKQALDQLNDYFNKERPIQFVQHLVFRSYIDMMPPHIKHCDDTIVLFNIKDNYVDFSQLFQKKNEDINSIQNYFNDPNIVKLSSAVCDRHLRIGYSQMFELYKQIFIPNGRYYKAKTDRHADSNSIWICQTDLHHSYYDNAAFSLPNALINN